MKLPFSRRQDPPTPEAIEAIKARAERDAALGGALHDDKMDRFRLGETRKIEKSRNKSARKIERIKAKAERRRAERDAGHNPLTLGVFLIRASSYVILAAAAVLTLAGLWYDVIFYGSQSTDWQAVVGLVALAVALRFCASGIPLLLEWAKPERKKKAKKKPTPDDPQEDASETPLRDLLGHSKMARWTLRLIFILSVFGCSVATLSFFSAGHEARTFKAESADTIEQTQVSTKEARIAALEKQREEAKKTRDAAIKSAQAANEVIKDQVIGTSTADNSTLQKTTEKIDGYNHTYQTKSDDIDRQINGIRSEVAVVEVTGAQADAISAPFLGVYRFLGSMGGSWTDEDWTIAGIWFFTFTFEFMFATLMAAAYSFLTATNGFAFWARARDAKQEIGWRLKVDEFESAARLESLRAQAIRDRQEADFNIALARDQAEQAERRAAVDREIAEVQRKAKEASDRLAAIAAGEDPEEYDLRKEREREKRQAEADKRKAESEAEIAAIRAEAERIRREAERNADRSANGRKGGAASSDARDGRTNPRILIAGDWTNEDPAYTASNDDAEPLDLEQEMA